MPESSGKLDMRAFALAGEVVAGRYRLLRYLDEGNFGAVYQASHWAYELELRTVAIKIAKRPMTDGQARRAFGGDALVMAKVQEAAPPNLRERFVTVYDAGICPDSVLQGHPYVAMEFVEGGSLKGALRYGAFPLKRAISCFDQILEAMACVQQLNYVHRDLKPSNILVARHSERDDVLKITDFGLAQEADSLLGWIESGGDLAHLAPECFTHEICSPKTDVYMLGLIFYEMITGKNPFADVGCHLDGKDPEKATLLKELHMRARDRERFELLERHEEIKQHVALGQVIRKALAPSMSARPYDNAVKLKKAWDEAIHLNGPPPSPEYPWQRVRRLTDQAEHLGLPGPGAVLLAEAMLVNRNKHLVPDAKVLGRAFRLQVNVLLDQGKSDEAWRLANEGVARRKCRSTLKAVAAYYEKTGDNKLASAYSDQAEACPDRD